MQAKTVSFFWFLQPNIPAHMKLLSDSIIFASDVSYKANRAGADVCLTDGKSYRASETIVR